MLQEATSSRLAAPGAKSVVAALLLSPELHLDMLVTLGAFALCGAAIDRFEQQHGKHALASLAAAQTAYLTLCAAIALWWSTAGDISAMRTAVTAQLNDPRVLWISTIYFAAVFGGGMLVQAIVGRFSQQLPNEKPGLQHAGKYIGWLERFLIVTFVLGGFGDAIGFLFAAKALVRFPEIQDPHGRFAEYFLIGTLTSVGLALLAGFTLQWAVG